MIYWTDKVIDSSKAKLSFHVFFKRAQGNQANIKTMLNAVLYSKEVFMSPDILPSQCDRIVSALHMIQESVRDLLDVTARIPSTLSHLRYPLVRELHKVDNLLSDLALIIPLFRADSQNTSYQSIEQQRDIQRKFDSLVQGYKDMLQELTILLDKAQFLGASSR
jgi:hypothetical protein